MPDLMRRSADCSAPLRSIVTASTATSNTTPIQREAVGVAHDRGLSTRVARSAAGLNR
jgi:hypothetical protein